MDIADKIAEARDNGHGISPHLEEILASLDARLSALEPKKEEKLAIEGEANTALPNPFNGERADS